MKKRKYVIILGCIACLMLSRYGEYCVMAVDETATTAESDELPEDPTCADPINPGRYTSYYVFLDEMGNPIEGVPCDIVGSGIAFTYSDDKGEVISSPPVEPNLTEYIIISTENWYDEKYDVEAITYVLKRKTVDNPTSDTNIVESIPSIDSNVTEPSSGTIATEPTIGTDYKKIEEEFKKTTIKPKKITLYKGKTSSLHLQYTTAFQSAMKEKEIAIKTITYTSLNSKCASVNQKGVIRAKKKGSTRIRITLQLSTGVRLVRYTKIKVKEPYLKITGVKYVKVGKAIKLIAKKYGATGTVKWSVSSKKYASIQKRTGILKGLKKGKVTVRAKAGNMKGTKVIIIK